MIIDLEEIEKLIQEGNLSEVSRKTGIPRRTIQDWKLGKNSWFKDVKERLEALQSYINKKRG